MRLEEINESAALIAALTLTLGVAVTKSRYASVSMSQSMYCIVSVLYFVLMCCVIFTRMLL